MILQEARKPNKKRRRILLGLLIAGVGVAALVYSQRHALKHRLATYREGKSLDQSRELASRGEWQSAMLAVRAAAIANPGGIAPRRQAAEILEEAGAASAVAQREEICQLAPDSLPDRVAWVQSALRFRDFDAAQRALAGFDPEQSKSPEIARLISAHAIARRQPAPAREALVSASQANPDDETLAFELATLDLRGANSEGTAKAKAHLESVALKPDAPKRQAARRELLLVASARGALEEAARWADLAADDAEATYNDEIRRLNAQLALHGWLQPQAWERAVATARTPADQAQLASWLVLIGQARRAWDWTSTLGAAADQAPLLVTRADAAAALADWPALNHLVGKGAWGEISDDTLTLARSFQILQERQQLEASRVVWLESLALERNNPAGLHVLLRLADVWKLPDYKKLTLKEIALRSPNGSWAVQQLVKIALAADDTDALRDSWALQLQIEPENRRAANEWAHASLLLDTAQPSPDVIRRLEELARLEPDNPRFVCTRALALWRDRRAKAALTLLETLPEETRRKPATALYYGLLLAANKRQAEALAYLELGRPTARLPQETRLLQNAQAPVATPAPAKKPAKA